MLPRPTLHQRPAAADAAGTERPATEVRDPAARPVTPSYRARPSVLGGAQQRLNFFGPPDPTWAGKPGR